MRLCDYQVKSGVLNLYFFGPRGIGKRQLRIFRGQRPDDREVEAAFSAGFCFTHSAADLGQPGANHGNRKLPLGCPVQRRNQSRQFALRHVLNFVKEYRYATFLGFGSSANYFNQVRQV